MSSYVLYSVRFCLIFKKWLRKEQTYVKAFTVDVPVFFILVMPIYEFFYSKHGRFEYEFLQWEQMEKYVLKPTCLHNSVNVLNAMELYA